MKLPLLTVFTDASFDAATGAAGWAVWAKRDDKGTFFYSAPFKMAMPGSAQAEAAAVACAAAVLMKAEWAGGDQHVLIKTDCLSVVDAYGRFAQRPGGKLAPYKAPVDSLRNAVRCLELRHVKAHVRTGDRIARHWVNERCDIAARAAMMKAKGAISCQLP